MTNILTIDNIKNYQYRYVITFSSDNLDTSYMFYFNPENVDWMDDSSFVISAGSQNCVLEGTIYNKNNENKVLAKLFIWDNTSSGHITKTYVSVMKISLDSVNNLRVSS